MTALLVAAALAGVPHDTTSYCLRGRMADGTYTRAGSAAHNGYPLGTRITVSPPVFGRALWTVRDRIGWGTQLDLWNPSCGASLAFGRRVVHVTKGWPRALYTRHKRVVVHWRCPPVTL